MKTNEVADGINKYGAGTYALAIFFIIFTLGVTGLGKLFYDTMVDNRNTNKQLIKTNAMLVDSNAETVKQIILITDNIKDMNRKLNEVYDKTALKEVLDKHGNVVGYTPVHFGD